MSHNLIVRILLLIAAMGFLAQGAAALQPDAPKHCQSCDGWNGKQEPFRIFGNTYYVGVAGLSAILITSDTGLVLLDGGLPQSAPLIATNIKSLGFRVEDIRLIVNSHAHFDHVGGIAALQRASGAVVAASRSSALALEQGELQPDDPQYGFGRESTGFPPVKAVRIVADNETLRVGELAITAHFTPGHTPGSTTWTWRSCAAGRCLDIVYADSLSSVSAPGFRYSDSPDLVAAFRNSIAVVSGLPCDVLISTHPEFSDLMAKFQRRTTAPNDNPFIVVGECQTYAASAAQSLAHRLAEETSMQKK